MRPIVVNVAWSVCLCMCLVVTTVSCAKTAELTPCGCGLGWARGTSIRWGPDTPKGRVSLGRHLAAHGEVTEYPA